MLRVYAHRVHSAEKWDRREEWVGWRGCRSRGGGERKEKRRRGRGRSATWGEGVGGGAEAERELTPLPRHQIAPVTPLALGGASTAAGGPFAPPCEVGGRPEGGGRIGERGEREFYNWRRAYASRRPRGREGREAKEKTRGRKDEKKKRRRRDLLPRDSLTRAPLQSYARSPRHSPPASSTLRAAQTLFSLFLLAAFRVHPSPPLVKPVEPLILLGPGIGFRCPIVPPVGAGSESQGGFQGSGIIGELCLNWKLVCKEPYLE